MRLLVIRTSAMGDVALTVPVLEGMRKLHPEAEIILLTRQAYKPFFSSIEGVSFFIPDLKKRHRGLIGIFRLFKDISAASKIDYVIDLHDVLRSKILRFFFMLSGVPTSVIDKGRREKKALINGKRKVKLKHSVQRYCDVFTRAGFPVVPAEKGLIVPSNAAIEKADSIIYKDVLNIGVAPYAKHELKIWPEEKMIKLLGIISGKYKCRFWLFGGVEESDRMDAFQKRVPGSENLIGKLSLDEELAVMSRLDIMIAMDSSNMHMAALTGTKVFTVWGATDPLTGFGAWAQPESYFISIPVDELTCRPCTIFGKGTCRRGDFACMNWLTEEMVYERMKHVF